MRLCVWLCRRDEQTVYNDDDKQVTQHQIEQEAKKASYTTTLCGVANSMVQMMTLTIGLTNMEYNTSMKSLPNIRSWC